MGYNILTILIIVFFVGWALYDDEDVLDGIVISIIIDLIILGILIGIAESTATNIGKCEVMQYEIQGLQTNMSTNSTMSGHFILGFGSVKGETTTELSYYYFRQDEFGSKIESISQVDNHIPVYVRETNEQKPCLIYVYQKYKFNKFFRFMLTKNEQKNLIAEVLVVPKNTIKIEYNADLK